MRAAKPVGLDRLKGYIFVHAEDLIMPRQRPMSITIVCIVCSLGALASMPIAFSDMARQIGSWYPPFLILSAMVGLIGMAGLWMMKRWGAIAYAGLFAAVQVVLLGSGLCSMLSVIGPGAVMAIAFPNYGAME